MSDIIDIKPREQTEAEATPEESDVRDPEFWLRDVSDFPLGPAHVFNTKADGDEEENAYCRAADIAMNMASEIPARVREANAHPHDAAFALWMMLTGVMVQSGWSACYLADLAHERQAELVGEDDDDDPDIDSDTPNNAVH